MADQTQFSLHDDSVVVIVRPVFPLVGVVESDAKM